jgi:hypothetical protein
LAVIAADIYKAERQNIFTIGKLLREAKEHFPHGSWLPWLKEIEWNPRTAQNYMAISELADKYESVSHLKASSTGLHVLLWVIEEHPDAAELAIERLKQSVERGENAAQQRLALHLTPMAKLNPGVGELALKAASDAINQNCFGIQERMNAMNAQAQAILRANPKTEDELKAIQDAHPIPGPDEVIKALGVPVVEDEDEADALEVEDDEDEAPKSKPVKKPQYKVAVQDAGHGSAEEAHSKPESDDDAPTSTEPDEPVKKNGRPLSRTQRWADAAERAGDALSELQEIQQEYSDWYGNLPDNLRETAVGEKLDTIINLDIEGAISTVDEARDADMPMGFGRD